MSVLLLQADARSIPIADETIQAVITSPPYWGLRSYDGDQSVEWKDGWRGGYGLEPSIEMYVEHSIEILREVRRVLRKDGVVFWNVGDSYAGSGTMGSGGSYGSPKQASVRGSYFATNQKRNFGTIKPKDLCLIPARVAIAAQEDGWWVRSLIIWSKPNPMPESVTDRPTDAYEHIIMLTKSENYFFDAEAVREPASGNTHSRGYGNGGPKQQQREQDGVFKDWCDSTRSILTTRNMRNVWEFSTQPFPDAHFATFPEELPRRCILAATSAKGACAQCGAPWKRVVERKNMVIERTDWGDLAGNRTATSGTMIEPPSTRTIGWMPTCLCKGQRGKTVPCRVLDPFGGSGTTGRVAIELNREAVLIDLHYHEIAERRTRNVQRRLL